MNKKIRLLALLLALVLMLCSCGSKKEEFSYSKGIDKEGFWEGVKALDYVTLPDEKDVKVSDEEIDYEIYYLMNQKSYMKKNEIMDRAVVNGDTLSIDFVGSVDGVEFEGGSTQGMGTEVTIGVTNYIDGFLNQLIGHKPGENFDINVTFPENYGNTDLAGKAAVFNITINSIIEYEAYDLTDNFVAGMLSGEYGVTTVAELRSLIKSNLIYGAFVDQAEYKEKLPDIIGEQYLARTKHELQLQANGYGKTLDEYVGLLYSSYGIANYDDLKVQIESYIPDVVKEELMIQAVAEAQNIKVSDADLEELFKQTEESYAATGQEFKKEDMIKVYGEPYIKQMALYDKVQRYFDTL